MEDGAAEHESAAEKTVPPARPRWKTPTLICAFLAGLAALTTSLNTIADNVPALAQKLSSASSDSLSWYHEDAHWKGHWTNKPEAYVDAADMDLSTEDMAMDLNVKKGVIEGTISTPFVCEFTHYDFLLVQGEVSGAATADITVWDTFEGHRVDVAKLRLKRNGIQMTVESLGGIAGSFPKMARLALDPSVLPSESKNREPFCADRWKMIEQAVKATLKSNKRLGTASQ